MKHFGDAAIFFDLDCKNMLTAPSSSKTRGNLPDVEEHPANPEELFVDTLHHGVSKAGDHIYSSTIQSIQTLLEVSKKGSLERRAIAAVIVHVYNA